MGAYRDGEGNYHDTNSFVGSDLLKLSELAREAYTRTSEFHRSNREQARENERNTNPERDARRAEFNERRGGKDEREPASNRER